MTVTHLLLDADDTLFASETPAWEASTSVVNRLMAHFGDDTRFEAATLRREAAGKNFRALATELGTARGRPLEPAALDEWVAEEQRVVTAHLREVLRPDPVVSDVLAALAQRFELAAVSSSALARLDACFTATGLAELLPPERRFSAEDSLPVPTSKPDPAVYRFAMERLGVEPAAAVAVEDSRSGATSAVAAGIRTIGTVVFVEPVDRESRVDALREAGVDTITADWHEIAHALEPSG